MSRENRRKVEATGSAATLQRPAAAPPRPQDEPGQRGTVSWRHVFLGLVAGELVLLVLSDGGLALANLAFGSTTGNNIDGGIVGVASFLAVLFGGYLAGRMAGRWELYQGFAVAVGFIMIAWAFQFGQEASVVHGSLQSGTHNLLDLGPMNMGGLISGDFIALLGGSIGGVIARRRGPAAG
jgi:hypothetical protein